MKRPCLLNTNTVGALSYCESFSCASTLFLKNSSLENLNSLTVSLFDQSVYSYCVTNAEAAVLLLLTEQTSMFLIMSFILFSPILIWMFLIHDSVTEDHLFYNENKYTIKIFRLQAVFYFMFNYRMQYRKQWSHRNCSKSDSAHRSSLRPSDGT